MTYSGGVTTLAATGMASTLWAPQSLWLPLGAAATVIGVVMYVVGKRKQKQELALDAAGVSDQTTLTKPVDPLE